MIRIYFKTIIGVSAALLGSQADNQNLAIMLCTTGAILYFSAVIQYVRGEY